MADYPIVYPNWGQSLGQGLQVGVEGVLSGLAKRYALERQNAQLTEERRRWEYEQAEKTGYLPSELERSRLASLRQQSAVSGPEGPELGYNVPAGQLGPIQIGQWPQAGTPQPWPHLVQPGAPVPSLYEEFQQTMKARRTPTLLPQEQQLLAKPLGMEPSELAGVRPDIARMAMPTSVFNPATQQWEMQGPKTKTIPGMPFLRPQYRTVGDAVVKIEPSIEGGEKITEIGLSPMAVGKARDAANQFNAALDSLDRISELTKRIYTSEKPADLTDLRNIFAMVKQGVKIGAERLAKTNTDVVQLAKAMNAFISLDVKALGDVGNLAYQDIERVKKAMPTMFENRESATAGIDLIRDVLITAADRRLASYSTPVTRQTIGGLRQTGQMPTRSLGRQSPEQIIMTLKAQGKTRDEIKAALKADGY